MAIAKGIGGGFPLGACLTTARRGKGMTAGTHGSTFGGNPLAMAVGNAVLDVVLAPGFLEHVRRMGDPVPPAPRRDEGSASRRHRGDARRRSDARARRRLPEQRIRRRAACREAPRRRRPRQCGAAAAAADHRRAEMREAIHRIDAAAATDRAQPAANAPRPAGRSHGAAPRHFLDLSTSRPASCARISTTAARMKARRRRAARRTRPLAGKMLAMIFDKPSTRTRVSFDVAMRELGGETIVLTGQEMQLGRGETIADTARVLSRYVDAIMIRTLEHDMLLELARTCRRAGDQRADAALASLPDHGGRHDLRGASRADQRAQGGVDRRRQQCAHIVDARRRANSISSLPSRRPPELAPKRKVLEWAGRRAPRDIGDRSRGRGESRRLRRHRHLGVDGRQGRRLAGTIACGPIRSTAS